jgi:hypothetical protein
MPSFFTATADRHHLRRHGRDLRRVRGRTAGLGIFMQVQKNSFRTDLVLAAVVVTATVVDRAVRPDLLCATARGAVERR